MTIQTTVRIPTLPCYGKVYGKITAIDSSNKYPYRVDYQIKGKWSYRWYAKNEITPVSLNA